MVRPKQAQEQIVGTASVGMHPRVRDAAVHGAAAALWAAAGSGATLIAVAVGSVATPWAGLAVCGVVAAVSALIATLWRYVHSAPECDEGAIQVQIADVEARIVRARDEGQINAATIKLKENRDAFKAAGFAAQHSRLVVLALQQRFNILVRRARLTPLQAPGGEIPEVAAGLYAAICDVDTCWRWNRARYRAQLNTRIHRYTLALRNPASGATWVHACIACFLTWYQQVQNVQALHHLEQLLTLSFEALFDMTLPHAHAAQGDEVRLIFANK